MRRFIKALAICVLLVPTAIAHADPDFNARAERQADYVIHHDAAGRGCSFGSPEPNEQGPHDQSHQG